MNVADAPKAEVEYAGLFPRFIGPRQTYIEEVGSDAIHDLVESATPGELVICALTGVEVTSALARRARAGDLSEGE